MAEHTVTRLDRAALLLVGFGFVGVGVVWLFAPARAAVGSGMALPTARAITDVRAIYGGFGVGFGGFLWYAAGRPALTAAALVGALAVCAGIAAGRLLGLVVDGEPGVFTLGSLAIELTGVGLAATALRRRRVLASSSGTLPR